jgi:hypothetical protein
MDDKFRDWPRGCEHGRSVLALGYSHLSGEYRICAGDAWQTGAIQNGWRDFEEGPPDPNLPVDCECACSCTWNGPFGVVSAAQGVLRCLRCQDEGHPPVGRWKADIMNTRASDLRW